jgi:hypothetical protein
MAEDPDGARARPRRNTDARREVVSEPATPAARG